MDRSYAAGAVRRRVRLDASIRRLSWRPVSFPLRLQPQSSARFAPEENSISIRTQEKWQLAGFGFGCNFDIGLRNFV